MKRGYEGFHKAAKANARKGQKKTSKKKRSSRRQDPAINPQIEKELRELFTPKTKGTKKAVKKRSSLLGNISLTLSLLLATSISAYGFIYPDEVISLLSRVEIGMIGQTFAADGAKDSEKKSKTKDRQAEKASSAKGTDEKNAADQQRDLVSEELSHFSKLSERKKELDRREQELAELEEELHKQKLEIDARIEKLEKIRQKISSVLKERVKIDQDKVKRLVEFYSSMKPKQAADIVSTLNEDLAVEILGQMKKKNAASIMNLLEPKKARTLSEKFAGYQRR